jgi:transposase-like protein
VVALLTGEVVSATAARDLDDTVRAFHQARLSDDYGYLFLDGVSLRVRPPMGRKAVQMLVAYCVRRDGTSHLPASFAQAGREPCRLGKD